MVREDSVAKLQAAGVIGVMDKTDYLAHEPEQPRIFELWEGREG